MCILAIAHRASSRYSLILAANRDERHARPASAARWWNGPGSLLAGRDLEAGGTWLGITGSGRFAAVTNIFDGGAAMAARSRGGLVTEFLESAATPAEYAVAVAADAGRYAPFNLVFGVGDALYFASNRNSSTALEPGVHVFSNNAPGIAWSKVDALADAVDRATHRADIDEFLIETLSGPEARGPLERAADSMFVLGDDFGTRCTTVLTVEATGRASFVEQRFDAEGNARGCSSFTFNIAESP